MEQSAVVCDVPAKEGGNSKSTELVVVTTDWKLEDAGGKTYGMCFVRVSPPYDHMCFKRGFSLPCPTHQRCALFAFILGMECVESIPVTTERPEYVIATKHAWSCDTLVRHKVDEWENRGRCWPKHTANVKGLLMRARDVMAGLPERSTLVYIPRDKDDPNRVDLIAKEEDTDVDAIAKKGGGPEEIEKALRDMRMRSVMINELMESGARSSRLHPSSEKKKTALGKKKKKMGAVVNQPSKEEKHDIDGIGNARQTDAAAVNTGRGGDGCVGSGIAIRPAEGSGEDAPVS